MFILEYGKEKEKIITKFNFFTCPASKTLVKMVGGMN